MVFRKCCIGGKSYHGDPTLEDEEIAANEVGDKKVQDIPIVPEYNSGSAGSSSREPTTTSASASSDPEKGNLKAKVKNEKGAEDLTAAVPDPLAATGTKALVHFHDAELTQDLQDAVSADAGAPNANHARSLNGFFSVLALCHTVLASVDAETGGD